MQASSSADGSLVGLLFKHLADFAHSQNPPQVSEWADNAWHPTCLSDVAASWSSLGSKGNAHACGIYSGYCVNVHLFVRLVAMQCRCIHSPGDRAGEHDGRPRQLHGHHHGPDRAPPRRPQRPPSCYDHLGSIPRRPPRCDHTCTQDSMARHALKAAWHPFYCKKLECSSSTMIIHCTSSARRMIAKNQLLLAWSIHEQPWALASAHRKGSILGPRLVCSVMLCIPH